MANAWSHTCMSHHRHPPTEEGGHKRRWTSFVEPPGEDSLKQARTRVLPFWRPLRLKKKTSSKNRNQYRDNFIFRDGTKQELESS